MVISDRRRIGTVINDENNVRFVEAPDLLWGRLRSGWDPWNLLNRIVYLSRDKSQYDLVHCFETRPTTIYPALFYLKRHKIPLVTDWNDWWGRGGIIDELRPRWYRPLFGRVETYYEEAYRTRGAGLTVISTALVKRAEDLGMSPERICHIPGGMHPDFFQYRPKEQCRKRVGLALSDPILGFSSFDGHWDLDIVMKALSRVAIRYPKVKLMITGDAGTPVRNLAKKHGVENNVLLTGYLPLADLPWWLGCCDLFVLPFPKKPYNVGRWPNKIGDYACLGRPTVSNPVGDIKTLFERHDIGVLTECNSDGFTEKIIHLLENPHETRRLGENARQLAQSEYAWRNLIGRLEDFYHKVLDLETQSPRCPARSIA
jgi:glycosyltransferase involved in cell wall biosynthesis